MTGWTGLDRGGALDGGGRERRRFPPRFVVFVEVMTAFPVAEKLPPTGSQQLAGEIVDLVRRRQRRLQEIGKKELVIKNMIIHCRKKKKDLKKEIAKEKKKRKKTKERRKRK